MEPLGAILRALGAVLSTLPTCNPLVGAPVRIPARSAAFFARSARAPKFRPNSYLSKAPFFASDLGRLGLLLGAQVEPSWTQVASRVSPFSKTPIFKKTSATLHGNTILGSWAAQDELKTAPRVI